MNERDSLRGESVFRDENVAKEDWPWPWALSAYQEYALRDSSVLAGGIGCRHGRRCPSRVGRREGVLSPSLTRCPHKSVPTQPLSAACCPFWVFLAAGSGCTRVREGGCLIWNTLPSPFRELSPSLLDLTKELQKYPTMQSPFPSPFGRMMDK